MEVTYLVVLHNSLLTFAPNSGLCRKPAAVSTELRNCEREAVEPWPTQEVDSFPVVVQVFVWMGPRVRRNCRLFALHIVDYNRKKNTMTLGE